MPSDLFLMADCVALGMVAGPWVGAYGLTVCWGAFRGFQQRLGSFRLQPNNSPPRHVASSRSGYSPIVTVPPAATMVNALAMVSVSGDEPGLMKAVSLSLAAATASARVPYG